MEHLAVTSGLDPVDFRAANIQSQHPLPEMIIKLKEDASYNDRLVEIATFNSQNKWKKRGLGFTPLCYQHDVIGGGLMTYSVQVCTPLGLDAVFHVLTIGRGWWSEMRLS